MGKSAGRWIKNVLFGKKYTRSNSSKNAKLDKKSSAKTPLGDLAGDSPVISDPFQFTDRGAENMEFEKGNSVNPCDTVALFPVNQVEDSQSNFVPVPFSDAEKGRQEQAATRVQSSFKGFLARQAFRSLKGLIRLQALIRGHLVRRQAVATLRCMNAIVKFQALARGRRVRISDKRQIVPKKYNVEELQDSKVVYNGANSFLGSDNLATNAFLHKFLVTLPTAMPLSLQYDLNNPNSASIWLKRWSVSHFWKPRKSSNFKRQRKPGESQFVETETGKSKISVRKWEPKRTPRKVMGHQTESVQEQPQNELERVKHNLRKVSSSVAADSGKPDKEIENPHQSVKTVSNSAVLEGGNIISSEKTKKETKNLHQSVKPVSNSAVPKGEIIISSEKTKKETKNPHQSVKTVSNSAVPEGEIVISSEKHKKERKNSNQSVKIVSYSAVPVGEMVISSEKTKNPNQSVKTVSNSAISEGKIAIFSEKTKNPHQSVKTESNPAVPEVEILTSENRANSDAVVDKQDLLEPPSKTIPMDEPIHPVLGTQFLENGKKTEEFSSKKEPSKKDFQKVKKRRSLPAKKQEYNENSSQNTPILPSYMATTESAKAKLRGGQMKFEEEDFEIGFVRRHSLPASINGKFSSLSHSIQKTVQANGKGGSKTDRSLTVSRDNKMVQPGWKR